MGKIAGKTAKDRILDAAERLFLDNGLNGAGVREISSVAGVNVASVNYYFGTKENLYREVIRRKVMQITGGWVGELRRAAGESDPPDLRKLIRVFVSGHMQKCFATGGEHRLFNLMSREVLTGGVGVEVLVKEAIGPVHKLMKEAIMRALPDIPEEKASLAVISMIGQTLHFVKGREVIRRLTGRGYSKEFVNSIIDHIVDFSSGGLGI